MAKKKEEICDEFIAIIGNIDNRYRLNYNISLKRNKKTHKKSYNNNSINKNNIRIGSIYFSCNFK